MSRSLKKGPFVEPKLLKRIEQMNRSGEKRVVKTWSRASVIFPQMVGHTIAIHDGRRHVPIILPKTWSDIASVNLRPRAISAGIRPKKKLQKQSKMERWSDRVMA